MAEKQVIFNKIFEIENEIDKAIQQKQMHPGNLAAGIPGAVLFYFYLYKLTGEEKYEIKANELFENTFSGYRFDEKLFSHCSGIAGLSWLTGHLIKNNFIDPSCYDSLADTEHFLYHKMIMLLKEGFYDFLHDGLSVYYAFLENDIQHYDKEAIIAEVVDILESISATNDDGTILWYNVDFVKRIIDTNECNLGLSHGMPSIIALLAKSAFYTRNPETKKKALELAEKGARFIRTLQSNDPSTLSFYPFGISKKNDASYNSRLAWCYGDLGIAISFWHLYETGGKEEWKNEAMKIMDKAAGRRDRNENLLYDAAICHGTSGVSHIFHRFYLNTQKELYQDSAKHWMDNTLHLSEFGDGIAGYKSFYGPKGYIRSFGLLEGVVGIGLSMMASISDNEISEWDKVWLIS